MTGADPEGTIARARFGPVRVIFGERGGRYPEGNSLIVEGDREHVLVDPSLALVGAGGELPRADRVLNSHCHEDHIAGNHLYPRAPWLVHAADRPGFRSLDDMMAIYGYQEPADEEIDRVFRKLVVEQFHYTPRADVEALCEGDRFDLGGVTLEVIHTPGHTRGHCCFLVEWSESGSTRRLLYLGDIDLSSFGPYYGDASSDLGQFRRSLQRLRQLPASVWITSHHKGVLTDRAAFDDALRAFAARLDEREARLLRMLERGPRTPADLAQERLLYPPGHADLWVDCAEARSIAQHLDELVAAGRVVRRGDARFALAAG